MTIDSGILAIALTVIGATVGWVITVERRLTVNRTSIAALLEAMQETNNAVEPLLIALGYIKTSKGWVAKIRTQQ